MGVTGTAACGRGLFERLTPVQLADGRTVAGLGRRSGGQRFEVLDEAGTVVAPCQPRRAFRARYSVTTTDRRVVVDLVIDGWTRSYEDAQVTLLGGRLCPCATRARGRHAGSR